MLSGKEFSLIRTVGGKVLYQGKAASLGIKQSSQPQTKWAELSITKSPKIVHIALGHDGLHVLMVAEDGSVYFVGTARRGEDGDVSGGKNVRRQPKPTKPRKMSRLESKFVTYAACSSCTSALVTRDGELYMFGKDTNNHCDPTTGLVTDLNDVQVTQVCLGKAHAVVLTNKGQVFTFGINNKGQCGREFSAHGITQRDGLNITMAEDEDETEVDETLCPPGKHKWVQEVCMICSICRECTGYGVSCIKSGRKDRNPGMPCGCGAGDSGCSECGACRVCAEEKLGPNELDERGLLDVMKASGKLEAAGKKDKMQLRQAQKLAKERKQREGANEAEAEVTKLVSLPPAEMTMEGSGSPAVQIAVGLHHTLVLLQNGDVYSFGSNNNGQLGHGDTKIRGRPTKVHLPLPAAMVATGSHHSVFLLTSGQVFTCGDHQKGSLGRNGLDESPVKSKNIPWYTVPGPVPGVGSKYGRRATWIGASGDQTIMRIDESLINANILARSNIFASKTCIGLIPRGEDNARAMKCLMISKTDGSCKSFSGDEQEDLSNQAVCLDPVYDVLWGYNPKTQEIRCYNVMISEAHDLKKIDPGYCDIFSPELAVPTRISCQATRSQCALHMLGECPVFFRWSLR